MLNGIGLGSTLVAPSPGTNATVGTTTYNHVAATNSLNSVNQTVSEVGVFRMTATPPANGYFTYTIPSAQSQPVGRFIPADFELVSGDIVPACSVFSYMGQPFGVTLDIIARNVAGDRPVITPATLPRAMLISPPPIARMVPLYRAACAACNLCPG